MLTIFGRNRSSACAGLSRRDFLTIGGSLLGGGLSLPSLLAAEARSGIRHSHRAVINVYLPGGPPHIDMWDLKPEAPAEVRGEFTPIATSVPGIEICELFPTMARMMDKLVIIRSLVGSAGGHNAYQCMTGRTGPQQGVHWPALGAWASKLQGPVNAAVPPHLSLMYMCGERNWGYAGEGGFLGVAHAPFRLVGDKPGQIQADNMTLKGITLEKLQDRTALLQSFDTLSRALDQKGAMEGTDAYKQQALGILTSSKLVAALDLSKEDPQVVARYGVDD